LAARSAASRIRRSIDIALVDRDNGHRLTMKIAWVVCTDVTVVLA